MTNLGQRYTIKFKTPALLKKAIDKYFNDCIKKKRPLTITGLALALNTSRETLIDYQFNKDDKFGEIIYKAKLMCQNYAEEFLFSGKQVAGAIFNLKNNYDWRDKTEVEHSGSINNLKELSDEELQRRHQEAEDSLGEIDA